VDGGELLFQESRGGVGGAVAAMEQMGLGGSVRSRIVAEFISEKQKPELTGRCG